ncbi:MAG: hypothetical protein JNL39_17795 [Opitutaceae bacterium]|nr:hypothetical protein [Opitutaceae bacterium]
MKLRRLVVPLAALAGATGALSADATTPIDYTQRNTPFAPAGGVTPEKQKPADQTAPVQDRRVEKSIVDKKTSPLGDRRAAVDVTEAHEKNLRDKDSRRPEKTEQPLSALNHKTASVSTADDTKKPPTVAKYQDSLSAASASNMARFPALDKATSAKINRFVFRKNPVESEAVAKGAAVTPAGGPAAVLK